MCLARVQFVDPRHAKEADAIEDVARIDRTTEGIEVTDLLGAVTKIDGDVLRIDFMESVVHVEKHGSRGDAGS